MNTTSIVAIATETTKFVISEAAFFLETSLLSVHGVHLMFRVPTGLSFPGGQRSPGVH